MNWTFWRRSTYAKLKAENKELRSTVQEVNRRIAEGHQGLVGNNYSRGYKDALNYIAEGVTTKVINHPARQSRSTRRTSDRR
jgi:hypothetical protein